MCKIIAIINDKGGVSKTTTTMNLGTALWLLGYRVLLVDSDKQCNLTVTMDKSSYAPGVTTLYDWMLDDQMAPPVYERYPGLDYIPSGVRIDDLNTWLADKVYRENYLAMRLDMLRPEYDFILIDCAPGCTSIINKNAIAAADGVIIPVRADLYSVQGKDAVINIIEQINKMMGKRVEMMGYLLTQFERTRMGLEVKDFFQGGSAPVFPVPIRKCAKCNEAPKDQMSLYEFAADSTAADDYMRLAEYLTNRLPRSKKWVPREWGNKASRAHDEFLKNQEGAQ
ncbi:MAG: ParA family protein [Bacteroidaceae bacterium]|nr:ParA family protein [Bacteroidaceae bacterium]